MSLRGITTALADIPSPPCDSCPLNDTCAAGLACIRFGQYTGQVSMGWNMDRIYDMDKPSEALYRWLNWPEDVEVGKANAGEVGRLYRQAMKELRLVGG